MKQKKNGKAVEFIKEHKMGLFVIVSALVMLVGLSYAWLQLTLRGEKELTLKAGTLELTLDDSMGEGITMENAVPVSDADGLADAGYTFTLKNTGTIESSYEIYLDDLAILETDTRMQDSFIKYQLTKDGTETALALLNTTGTHPNRVLDSGTIAPNTTQTYTLKVWIDSATSNEVMGTVFKGQLRIEAMQKVKETTEPEPEPAPETPES